MTNARGPSALPWLVGGLALAPAEVLALETGELTLIVTVVTLLAGIGLICGLIILATDAVIRRLPVAIPVAGALRALPAAAPLVFVAAHLFDGGFASTLPGAAWGPVWVPILGTLLLAAALAALETFCAHGVARMILAVVLVIVTCVVEYSNRAFLPTLYQDLHAFAVLTSVICAGAAIHLVGPRVGGRWTRRLVIAAVLCVLAAFTISVVQGLERESQRSTVADRGMHARQIVRLIRAGVDIDGDGYSPVLGGGDCDDRQADIHPAARDVPANDRDEDCDGADASPLPPPPPERIASRDEYQRLVTAWHARPEIAEILAPLRDYHVVLCVVDALRADSLDPEHREEFPTLHALADESQRFRRAFAPSAGTDVSVASFLTGRTNPFRSIDTTLIEAMAATGRTTHAVLPREVLRWAGRTLISRGLASRDRVVTDREERDIGKHSTGRETTDRGLAFVDSRLAAGGDEPVFLWLHYFDVHEHHQMEATDPRLAAVLDPGDEAGRDGIRAGYNDVEKHYWATVKLVDDDIARVIDELKKRAMWDRTIFVVLSDHGESLGEDPRLPRTHSAVLYNPLIAIPLVIRVPGLAPAVIDHPVSLIDVSVTLVALAGATPLPGADGIDLTPHLLAGAPERLRRHTWPLPLNESEQHGLIDWPHKLLIRPADNLIEVYDIARDRAELENLSRKMPDLTRRLRAMHRELPEVIIDRTRKGRKAREKLAQRPERSTP